MVLHAQDLNQTGGFHCKCSRYIYELIEVDSLRLAKQKDKNKDIALRDKLESTEPNDKEGKFHKKIQRNRIMKRY